MPWTEADVEEKKKGLNPKQKKQWVRIANTVLKKEMKAGKSEEDAAVSAIKQANGVVMNVNESKGKYAVYKNKQVLDYEVKLTVHQEKAHLVIPVVMMVEGVHHGSQGPLLHSIDELGKFPESWNGIPVVVYHPEEDGSAVSANSPDIIDKMTVGRVYNTIVEGKRLKAEVWLDEDKLNLVSCQTLEDINDTKEVEVSLGMFTENEMVAGFYGEEEYAGVARNHRPDHLAILPDQIGACSCADGCGLGANKEIENIQDKEIESGKIKSIDSVNVPNSGWVRNDVNINKSKEENKMAKNECPKCLEKINTLIANKESGFVEADREWLEVLNESALDKVITPKVKEVEKIVEKVVEVNKLSADDQAALAFGKRQMKERKEKMVKGIQDNTEKGIWDETVLNSMSEDLLERVFNSVKKEEESLLQGNYLLNAGGNLNVNVAEEAPLAFNGVELK